MDKDANDPEPRPYAAPHQEVEDSPEEVFSKCYGTEGWRWGVGQMAITKEVEIVELTDNDR